MRLKSSLFGIACALAASQATAQDAPAKDPSQKAAEDLLGNMVVVAGATRPLPKIGILPSLASELEDVTAHDVLRRDLDLCGEFEVLAEKDNPDGLYLSDSPIDVAAWKKKGVEALVRIAAKKSGADKVELRAQAYLLARGQAPVFDKRFLGPLRDVRDDSHRVADLVIGALTGQNGGFSSHMTFASAGGGSRQVYTIDADGHDAKIASPTGLTAIAPAFRPTGELVYAAAAKNELFALYLQNQRSTLNVTGSVYGVAWSKDGKQVAATIGTTDSIQAFLGPDLQSLKPASTVPLAMHPTFTPSGKLAFVGEGKIGMRVYVDGKAITPDGLFASSPTFCNHPDGVKTVFAVGVGKDTDLVATGETGGGLARLTQSQGQNSSPACSPDGRLVAFFSTRKSDEGPGLYVMRVDGRRPKRISPLLGDSLRWEPLPPGQLVEQLDPKAQAVKKP